MTSGVFHTLSIFLIDVALIAGRNSTPRLSVCPCTAGEPVDPPPPLGGAICFTLIYFSSAAEFLVFVHG